MTEPVTAGAGVKILTIEGRGWKEAYEEKPNGDCVLIYSNVEPHLARKKLDDTESIIVEQDMPWSEFCKQYRNNPKYAIPKTSL